MKQRSFRLYDLQKLNDANKDTVIRDEIDKFDLARLSLETLGVSFDIDTAALGRHLSLKGSNYAEYWSSINADQGEKIKALQIAIDQENKIHDSIFVEIKNIWTEIRLKYPA